MSNFSRRSSRRKANKNYSAFRSGAVDLLESAVGLGDEADALYRRLSGEARTFDQGLDMSRRDLDKFERENSATSKVLTGAGLVGGMLIPGGAALKLAQSGSKLSRAVKVGMAASAEGAAYGYAAGRDEERLSSAAFGASIGGVLGGAGGAFLTKTADELAEQAAKDAPKLAKKVEKKKVKGKNGKLKTKITTTFEESHISGPEGYSKLGAVSEKNAPRKSSDTSANQKQVKKQQAGNEVADDGVTRQSSLADLRDSIYKNAYQWTRKFVGARPARLTMDADTEIRAATTKINEMAEERSKIIGILDDPKNADFAAALNQAGRSATKEQKVAFNLAKGEKLSFEKLKAYAPSDELRRAAEEVESYVADIKKVDFKAWTKDGDYVPTLDGKVDAKGVGVFDEYASVQQAMINLDKDVTSAALLAEKFGIDVNKLKKKGQTSRTDAVIEAIQKQVTKEAGKDTGANMGNVLRSVFVAANKGGEAVGSQVRKATSMTLLANPWNALLNLGETVTAPIVQNGVKAWAATMPKVILNTLLRGRAEGDQKWLTAKQLGVDDSQFAGELMQIGESTFSKGLQNVSKFMYKATGTSRSHTATQEALANSAIKKAVSLAKKGDDAGLAKHKGMEGLNADEIAKTKASLLKFDEVGFDKLDDKEVGSLLNFSGAAMNEWQAISALSMPKAFLDNPNGRVMYSMLSYMNLNLNNVQANVGQNLMKAQKLGMNTKEGREAVKEAARYSAKWTAMFGVFAGLWDDSRKTLFLDDEDKTMENLFTPDGVTSAMLNQVASNVSGGLVNIRSAEYGGDVIDPVPAPVGLALRGVNAFTDAAAGVAQGEEGAFDSSLRFAQSSLPGLSVANKVSRSLPQLREVGITSKPASLFERIGLLED